MLRRLSKSFRSILPTSTSGENIGARLRADQAEADTRVARAEAEQRRAEAIATEQAMKAKVAENRALLVLAEAEVPKAMPMPLVPARSTPTMPDDARSSPRMVFQNLG